MPTDKFPRPLCAQCGKRLTNGKRLCKRHRQLDRDRQRARAERKKQEGLCYFASCKTPHKTGRIYCSRHVLYKQRSYTKSKIKRILRRLENDAIRATREGLGQLPTL